MAIIGGILGLIGGILGLIGIVIALVYTVVLIIKAFQTHILWGLGYIFVPFVALIFIIMNWNVAGKPFLMSLISIPFIIAGGALTVMGAAGALEAVPPA